MEELERVQRESEAARARALEEEARQRQSPCAESHALITFSNSLVNLN